MLFLVEILIPRQVSSKVHFVLPFKAAFGLRLDARGRLLLKRLFLRVQENALIVFRVGNTLLLLLLRHFGNLRHKNLLVNLRIELKLIA